MIEDAGLAMKEEDREEYDQYNDDPTFNNRQREYYNQRSVCQDLTNQLFSFLFSDLGV